MIGKRKRRNRVEKKEGKKQDEEKMMYDYEKMKAGS